YRIPARPPAPASGSAAPPGRPGSADGRAPEEWGFLLAAAGPVGEPGLGAGAPVPRSLGEEELREGARAADRLRLPDRAPSTLIHPRYWEDA
ncbi:spermidine synthase, partial [Streptomyces rhizosphaericola]